MLDLPIFEYAAKSYIKSLHIRLLEVPDGRERGLLKFRLDHMPPSLPYQALSYTWGRELPQKGYT